MYIWHVYSSLHVSTPCVHIYIYIHVCIKSIYIYLCTYTCIWWIFDSNVRCRSIYTYITSNRYVIYVYTYMRMLYIWPWSWWWSMNMIQTWDKFQCFKWHQSFDKNEKIPSCASEQWTLLPFFGPTAQLRWNEVVENPLQKENLKWWTNASDGHLASTMKDVGTCTF